MSGGAKDQLRFELDEGVGILTLNRPDRLNAIHWDLAVELVGLLRELRQRDEVRTIVLTGAGRAFCSGGDAEWLSGSSDRGLPGLTDVPLERYQRKTPAGPVAEVTRMLVEVDKPVIAAITGPAMGAGLAFALACDRRIGDRTTRMCAAMVRLGFAPDCGITYFLPRVTSLSTALMMVETGRILEAEECHREGLLDELVENGEALPRALAYAKELAPGPERRGRPRAPLHPQVAHLDPRRDARLRGRRRHAVVPHRGRPRGHAGLRGEAQALVQGALSRPARHRAGASTTKRLSASHHTLSAG